MPTNMFDGLLGGTGELTTTGVILRLALVGCSMFAMVHLISLWGTRYGDNNTLSKSFFLSLVLHGCFGLGWATVAENYPQRPTGAAPTLVQTPITILDDVDSAPIKGTSQRPIFYPGPANSEIPLARETRSANRIDSTNASEDIESPQSRQLPLTPMPKEMPQFTNQAEERSPDVDLREIESVKSAAPSTEAAEQTSTTAENQNSRGSIGVRAQRSSIPDAAVETPSRPSVSRGSASRLSPIIDAGAVPAFSTDSDRESPPKVSGQSNDEMIRRPGSPTPAVVVDPKSGTDADLSNTISSNTTSRLPGRAARGLSVGTDADDIAPTRASANSRRNGDRNRLTDTQTSDDRMITGGLTSQSVDDSPQPKLELSSTRSVSRAPARAPETYQARSQSQRMSSVLKNGGSQESERAVEESLKWLSSIQERDGRWSAARFGGGADNQDKNKLGLVRLDDGKFADTGVTGLVILSFLGAGYSHEKGPYTDEVHNALDWLIGQQDKRDGYLGGKAKNYDQNYCHAIATFALGEAYAMQKDANDYPALRNAVKLGIRRISDVQNEDGGWRYSKVYESDMSMFGWQLMALKSAVNAGISVKEETRQGMIKFLKSNGIGEHGGLAGYKKDTPPTAAMTAEALFCRQMFAVRANDDASREAVSYLLKNLPKVTEYDEYYWYYGTLAMRNADAESWQKWNAALRDMLVSLQRKQGSLAGSWDPQGKWAGIGGRLYSTALSTMCLEVYYRYQSNAKPSDTQ